MFNYFPTVSSKYCNTAELAATTTWLCARPFRHVLGLSFYYGYFWGGGTESHHSWDVMCKGKMRLASHTDVFATIILAVAT